MTAETAAVSKTVRRMLGISLHGWENSAVSFAIAAAVFTLLAGFSSLVVVRLQRVELANSNAEFARYKLTVEGQVADAKKEGIEAGKTAGGALLEAAKATERAAKAELELEKYRSGRSLTPEQHRVLVQWLGVSPKGRVIVKPNFLDGEATRYANQLCAAFNDAGFSGVGDAPLQIVSSNRPGLFLAVRDGASPPPHTNSILKAFSEAGIPVESGYADWVPDGATVVILVSERQ